MDALFLIATITEQMKMDLPLSIWGVKMATNALIAQEKGISEFLHKMAPNLRGYALSSYKEEEFLKSAMMAISENDELRKCLNNDQGKMSLYKALKFGATTGLSLNPHAGEAALIAYSGKITYQVMKNGMVELAMRSGKVNFITSDTVREADTFEIHKTMDGDSYSFSPARKNRGDIDGFFAALRFTDGVVATKYMTVEEVEAFRDNYSAYYNAKKAGPWKTSFEGMALKTVMKSLLRSVSISTELDNAVGVDDAYEVGKFSEVATGTTDAGKKGATPADVGKNVKAKKEKQTVETVPDAEPAKPEQNEIF